MFQGIMHVGVIGSRDFANLSLVRDFIDSLPSGTIVVSGGAEGVDQAAVEAARARGLRVIECLPDTTDCKQRFEFTKKFYERNQQIVDSADELIAFTDKDKGGTWDTIKRAKKKKISTTVHKTSGEVVKVF